jgi:hypothetical protein
MDSLQRVGGNLESHRRPSGRRAVLLPYEVDLCEQLGITADEYWEFIANAHDFIKERPEEFERIPDIQNVSITALVVNIVVGIALTAISALLAPKPKAPSQPEQKTRLGALDIEGSQGRSRYTKASNFDSVQSLANLGETIPLVFADQSNKAGGIRVDTQLLFSQMITAGTTQTLLAVMMLGAGKLREKPDYEGYAIGDLMLRDFSQYKQQLFCNLGDRGNNRLKDGTNGDQYEDTKLAINSDGNDAFSVFWSPDGAFRKHFSGTRTPSSRTSFGLFNPLPNGFRYLVPYELVLVPSGDIDDNNLEQQAEDSTMKRDKVMRYFSRYGGIISANNTEAVYYLSASRIETDKFSPWGTADVLQAQDETRITIDEILQEGQEYMLGTCRAICINRPEKQFAPEDENGLKYTFKITDELPGGGSDNDIPIAGTQSKLDQTDFKYEDKEVTGPWSRGCVQQLAVASLSNTRRCDATEIGIRSEVWRQCQNTANFNAHPDGDTIDRYQEANSSINLGTVTKYTKRYSFFRIYARKANAAVWQDINDGRAFAVRGVSPEYVFNTLFIKHNEGQHEFEIVPVPGSKFYGDARSGGIDVHLLDGRALSRKGSGLSQTSMHPNGYQIFYTGVQDTLTLQDVTNPEWIFSYTGQNTDAAKDVGPVTKLGSYSDGNPIPKTKSGKVSLGKDWNTDKETKAMVKQDHVTGLYTFWWNGEIKGQDIPKEFVNVIGGGGRELQYRTDELKDAIIPSGWGETKKAYDMFDDKGNLTREDGVVLENGIYNYYWNGVLVISTTRNDSGWIQNSTGLRQYERTGGVKAGGTETVLVQDELFNVASRDNKNRIVSVNTGMRVNTTTGNNEFYRSGVFLGVSNGNNKNSFRPGGGVVWERGSTKHQDQEGGRIQDGGSRREIDWPSPPSTGTVKNSMKYGAILRPGSNGALQIWWDSEYKGTINPTDTLYASDGYEYTVDGAYPGETGRIKGEWYRVFSILRFENKPLRYEYWSIDKSIEVVKPDTWEIARQVLEGGQDGRWSIEKFERGVVGEVEGKTSPHTLKEGNRDSAEVRVTHYVADKSFDSDAKDAYTWKLSKGGNGYKANTFAEIVGTPINRVKITEVRLPSQDLDEPDVSNDDVNERFWDFTQPNTNYSPLNAICDYYINNTDTSSHANGPEHSIVFCNELIEQFDPNAGQDGSESPIPKYPGLALTGIKLLNSKEWTSFNSLSAYIQHGHMVERLFSDKAPSPFDRSDTSSTVGTKGATHLFPEIAYHLLTDQDFGAGELIGAASVDRDAMEKAARFCQANGFFWDGIITEGQNLREFIFENAAYMLLDFTIKGGKFALLPSVPYGGDYKMARNQKPVIKALFTDGNMRGMQISFLTPEERQPFIGVCIFRKEKRNAFPELRTMTMRLSNAEGGNDSDPIEKFDCSGFMTSENHARMFLRYALKVRQLVDHGIKFETTPQSAMNLEPGEYFRVASKSTHTDRFTSGSVDFEGNITTSEPIGEGVVIDVVYWKPGSTEVSSMTTAVRNNKVTQSQLFGCLFCQKTEKTEARVYKCESLSYADDGLVEVTGSSSPLNDRGQLLLLDWDADSDFVEEVY